MPGIPEVKAAGWLVPTGTSPDDEYARRLLFVRLEQEKDEPYGWTVELHECERPGRRVKRWYATEADARTATGVLYQLGEAIGTWRWQTYPRDVTSAPSGSSPGFARTRARGRRGQHADAQQRDEF
jgi:hypothetical protein